MTAQPTINQYPDDADTLVAYGSQIIAADRAADAALPLPQAPTPLHRPQRPAAPDLSAIIQQHADYLAYLDAEIAQRAADLAAMQAALSAVQNDRNAIAQQLDRLTGKPVSQAATGPALAQSSDRAVVQPGQHRTRRGNAYELRAEAYNRLIQYPHSVRNAAAWLLCDAADAVLSASGEPGISPAVGYRLARSGDGDDRRTLEARSFVTLDEAKALAKALRPNGAPPPAATLLAALARSGETPVDVARRIAATAAAGGRW